MVPGRSRDTGLSGWVRNRRSGDVEAVLAGPLDVVDEMLAALWTGPAGASVSAVEGTPTEERPRGDFDVRPTV
ncbi:acylphosphatase [Aurantimonas sp. C2-6-R+9]|uniref:acylphosphatase n=1 Tax=Aurantimonas sp. C2-6-R+9 TaxID=3114365 RepID=UPI003FA496A8